MKNVEGKPRVFYVRASQLPDDVTRFIVLCTDITELEQDYKENERLAVTDSLTGLYNRFKYQALLAEQWEKAYYGYDTFSVVLMDVDHFQSINDTYGHDYGDLALVQLSDLLRKHMRPQDTLARWEGGTFALLLPHATGRQAFQFAESLRFFVETKKFTGLPKLTVSFGAAQHEMGIGREKVLQRAEAALQQAKRNGRNQGWLFRKEKK
nr:GGDEF domain-containing protein [Ectobacillus ponti]